MSKDTMTVHYSSKQSDWETPHDFFAVVESEFHFTLDVCAVGFNSKCEHYITPEQDGLLQRWVDDICWLNPPYGRAIGKWMAKASLAGCVGGTVVCLVPARTDTKWWWDYCVPWEIRFLPGRLRFITVLNGVRVDDPAPFPSALVVMGKQARRHSVSWWDWKTGEYR